MKIHRSKEVRWPFSLLFITEVVEAENGAYFPCLYFPFPWLFITEVVEAENGAVFSLLSVVSFPGYSLLKVARLTMARYERNVLK